MSQAEANINKEYLSRINKALDYIENNLEKQLTLDELAAAANFSKFHFHRIFQGIIGETPFQFILRIRLEKAAAAIIRSNKESITDIALQTGFSDPSIFSRNFKSYFKLSPSQYRKKNEKNSNLSQVESKMLQVEDRAYAYFCSQSRTIKWETNMRLNQSLEIKELQPITVAYLRYIGPFRNNKEVFDSLWGKMFAWAGANGLMQQKDLKFITAYHDNPNITAEDKLRLSICASIPEEMKVSGEFGKMKIEGGKYMVARFNIGGDEFQEAWEWVFGQWFPTSGYQPDDKPHFEVYVEEPKNGRFTIDICVPIKPL